MGDTTVGATVGAVVGGKAVGGTVVGAGVAAGAQAENNTHPSINIETNNLWVFIFSPLANE